MRNRIGIFLFLIFSISTNAQRRFSPTGFASPYSTNWYRVGWIMADSGAIDAIRDTTIGASFPGVRFLWLHPSLDSSEWVFNGNKYVKQLNTQDTLPGRFLVTTSSLASQGFLKNITGYIQQGTNVILTGSGTLGSPYVINASGGSSVDSAVNPGLFLKQTISGTTKTIYADSSFATGLSGYYLRRIDTSVYVTPTQLSTGLATKQGIITTGTTLQYYRGDLSLATFPTNLSAFTNGPGYITNNQSITFTASGDINGTYTNPTVLTPTLTINANAVTYSKFQQAVGQGLLGAQSAGNYGLITIGSGLIISGSVLSATGSGGSSGVDTIWRTPGKDSIQFTIQGRYHSIFDSVDGGSGSGITQLTGDGTAGPGSGSQAFTLATVNSNIGTFGSASAVAQFTANGKGLVTAITAVPIQIAESQVTSLTSDLAGKQSTLSNTPSGGFPLFNLNASAIRELFAGTNVTIDSTTHTGGYTINSSGGGAVSSVSNSDGTLTISPTTGAVVASLALGHANTWITNPQTFNGGVALGSNVTFATDNTYNIGTSSVGANTVNTRFVSSPGILSLQTAGSNPIVFGPNSATKMQLAVTGQLQLNAYTTSTSFTGTPLAFLQTDASGDLIQTPLSSVQTALSGTGYVKFAGITPSYLTPTQVTADLNLFTSSLQGLVPSSGGGTTNYLRADGTWAAPSGGGGSLPSGISPLYLQATGTSTYQFADPRQLDTLYIVDDGQSNDYGNADAGYIGDTLSDSRVQVADTVTGGWKVAHAGFYPFNIQSPTQYSLSHSFYFARKLAREQGKIVRLIHNGHNGQTISAWFTTTSQSLLDTLVQRINRFVPSGYRIVLFDWDQGESDNSTVFGTYNIAWDSVKANLHRRCPSFALSTMIAVVGMPQVALGAPTGYQGQDPNLQTRDYNLDVRDAYINTDSAYINTTSASNPVHFNADGLKYIGVSAIYNFYQGLALYYTRNNPGTLAGAPINPGRITVRYTEAPGGGAYYDAVNAMNRSATGRTGVHLLSSDSTSTVGYFGLAGPSGSYIAANQVVLFSETNSDLLLGRNFVTYIDFTSTGVTMPQKLLYTASTEASFTNTTAASGAGFTFTGDASNFVNLQLGNSGSTIANSFNIYVNNGYKALLQPTGTIIMDSTVYSGGVARSTLDVRGSMSYRIDSFGVTTNTTLGNHQNVALFKTGATNDTCYLPNATTGVYRRYIIKKTDTGAVGNVVIIPFTNQSIDKALGNYVLTQTSSTVTIESDGLSTWYKIGSSATSGTTYTFTNGLTNSSGTVSLGGPLTGATTITGTGQTFTYTAGGTGTFKWSGFSQDTTSTVGVDVVAPDSSRRMIPWAKFALKLADYLPTYNIYAHNGLYSSGGDSIGLGTNPLDQNTTLPFAGNTLTMSGGPLAYTGGYSWGPGSGLLSSTVSIRPGVMTDVTSAASSTLTNVYVVGEAGPTLGATNTSVTYTNAYSFFINGPTAGTNVTITNPYALGVTGNSLLQGAVAITGSLTAGTVNIYGKNDLTAQTGAVGTVTSYSVSGSGSFNTFRVGGYITVTAVSLDVIQLQVTWTDETNTSRTQSFFVQGATTGISATGANAYSPMDIRVKQGTTITVATVLTTGTGSITYDVGATITQLY